MRPRVPAACPHPLQPLRERPAATPWLPSIRDLAQLRASEKRHTVPREGRSGNRRIASTGARPSVGSARRMIRQRGRAWQGMCDLHAIRALRRSCRARAARSCFRPFKRPSRSSRVGRCGRVPGAKGGLGRLLVALAFGRGSGGHGERPAGAWERSRCSGTGCQSRSPAVADIIGARRACTVAMISSVSIPWR